MGTYFALMDEAAKRGEDYEILEQIPEILHKVETGTAKPEEISKVIDILNDFEGRITALVNQATPMGDRISRIQEVLKHLQSLKGAIQSAPRSSWSAART